MANEARPVGAIWTALPADTTAPDWEFAYAYTLPSDCLRILKLEYRDTNYQIEGRKIVTDEPAPLKIQYVAQINNNLHIVAEINNILHIS